MFKTWAATATGRFIFLDEAGSNIAMTREHARSPQSERARDVVPRNRGTVTTMLGALTLDGISALMTIEGGTSAEVFQVFVEQFLVPTIQPGDKVVLDNLAAHKDADALQAIRDAGATVIFLPPYSPEFNPIEMAWAKLKRLLRDAKARTREALDLAIAEAIDLITSEDARGWFRHCGYLLALVK